MQQKHNFPHHVSNDVEKRIMLEDMENCNSLKLEAFYLALFRQAFSQYRKLSTKPRKSKRYGHLCRNRPLEPSSFGLQNCGHGHKKSWQISICPGKVSDSDKCSCFPYNLQCIKYVEK